MYKHMFVCRYTITYKSYKSGSVCNILLGLYCVSIKHTEMERRKLFYYNFLVVVVLCVLCKFSHEGQMIAKYHLENIVMSLEIMLFICSTFINDMET